MSIKLTIQHATLGEETIYVPWHALSETQWALSEKGWFVVMVEGADNV